MGRLLWFMAELVAKVVVGAIILVAFAVIVSLIG